MKKIEDFFKAFPEAREVFIDGTERPIQRPKDKERQKANYSGKKKRHTRKNLVIIEKIKHVRFLSKTVEGKKHNFTLLKEEAPPENMLPKIKKHMAWVSRECNSNFRNISYPCPSGNLEPKT